MEMMIIMFSPVFALALFLFLPFQTALPIYIPIFIFGVIVNYKMMRSMKLPVRTGLEEMMGQEAVIINDIEPEGKVQFKDEIWAATAKGERVEQGERVRIVGSRGLVLVVEDVEVKVNPVNGEFVNLMKTARRNDKTAVAVDRKNNYF